MRWSFCQSGSIEDLIAELAFQAHVLECRVKSSAALVRFEVNIQSTTPTMSIPHHSQEEFEAQRRFVEQVLQVQQPSFPQGELSKEDEGELAFAVACDVKGQVVKIAFTKPVAWLGLDLVSCRNMIKLLQDKANALERSQRPSRD